MTDAALHPRRLLEIDALRGVAASAVFVYHLTYVNPFARDLESILPRRVSWLAAEAEHGVEVFFVLSGFVIVLSLSSTQVSSHAAGRFMVRRQARLDPPYWAAVLLGAGALAFEAMLGYQAEGLSVGAFALNLVYLQNITGSVQVLPVAWSLCLEIQFYASLILGLLAARRWRGRRRRAGVGEALPPEVRRAGVVVTIFVTGAASLWASRFMSDHVISTWAVGTWHLFALGALAAMALHIRSPWARSTFVALLAMELFAIVLAIPPHSVASLVAGASAAGFIVLSAAVPAVAKGVGAVRVLQYLGSRSYSLYLVHLTVIVVVTRVGYKLTGGGVAGAVAWTLVAGVASFAAAEAFFRAIEGPSLVLSRWVRNHPLRAAVPTLRSRLNGDRTASTEP
jgi:hypothetical protein